MRILAGFVLVFATINAGAQPSMDDAVRRIVASSPPVTFAGQPLQEVPFFGSLSNVTIKPKGEGPFPAVVLVHTCGGIKDPHIAEHARELVALGYVVTVRTASAHEASAIAARTIRRASTPSSARATPMPRRRTCAGMRSWIRSGSTWRAAAGAA